MDKRREVHCVPKLEVIKQSVLMCVGSLRETGGFGFQVARNNSDVWDILLYTKRQEGRDYV